MFKPQGGSLHTDENMSVHEHRFCFLGEKTKACVKHCAQGSKGTRDPGVAKLMHKLKKLRLLRWLTPQPQRNNKCA